MRNDLTCGFAAEVGFLDRSAASTAAATGFAGVAPGMLAWQDGRDLAFAGR